MLAGLLLNLGGPVSADDAIDETLAPLKGADAPPANDDDANDDSDE